MASSYGRAHGGSNSRAHEGRDTLETLVGGTRFVSIHAPTRGATVAYSTLQACLSFQFTRPRGARRTSPGRCVTVEAFQFTRPRGARPRRSPATRGSPGFNSRAHEGRDRVARHPPAIRLRFNSRAHEGRDLPHVFRRLLRDLRFNSRAHEGRDLNVFPHSKTPCLFQFTRPRGARPGRRSRTLPIGRFQFTRPRGARLGIVRRAEDGAGVSIHAPTRGATQADYAYNRDTKVSIHAPTRGATGCCYCYGQNKSGMV